MFFSLASASRTETKVKETPIPQFTLGDILPPSDKSKQRGTCFYNYMVGGGWVVHGIVRYTSSMLMVRKDQHTIC